MKTMHDDDGNPITLTDDGFRVYTDDVPIRLGDVIRLRPGISGLGPHDPYAAMIVCGFEKADVRHDGASYRPMWWVARVHCRADNLLGYVPKDAQPSARFERLLFAEEELRAKCVAYTTGPSGRIDNRCEGTKEV